MRKWIISFGLFLAALPMLAQSGQDVTLFYGADFQYHFDNREYSASSDRITPSYTEHAAIFTPTLGLSWQQNSNAKHSIIGGVDLRHDMGEPSWRHTAKEAIFYYKADVNADGGRFQGVAGVFPRRLMEGSYSEAFYADSVVFNDRNLEGILLKWQKGKFFTEFGCDWMGKFGHEIRERFQLFSAGSYKASDWLTLGWTGVFYHYACSELASAVVDNHLLEPWAKADFSGYAPGWKELSIQAGILAGYQRNRKLQDKPDCPVGAEITLTAQRKNIILRNISYFGDNLQAMYHERDEADIIYGNNLYPGLPFYTGFYDRVELSWEPQLAKSLSLRLAARAHFSKDGFMGWQQVVSLRFNLESIKF